MAVPGYPRPSRVTAVPIGELATTAGARVVTGTESGVLVGLLSLGDVARYVRQHSRANGSLAQQRLAETPAIICEPRFHSIPPPPPSSPSATSH